MLQNSKVPVHSSSTLPYLKPRGESRTSLSIGRFQENTNSTGSHPNLERKKFSTICTIEPVHQKNPAGFLMPIA